MNEKPQLYAVAFSGPEWLAIIQGVHETLKRDGYDDEDTLIAQELLHKLAGAVACMVAIEVQAAAELTPERAQAAVDEILNGSSGDGAAKN